MIRLDPVGRRTSAGTSALFYVLMKDLRSWVGGRHTPTVG